MHVLHYVLLLVLLLVTDGWFAHLMPCTAFVRIRAIS